ncbi:tetratricopeptide repeat protein [Solimicrobium silvestre]|uniref:Tetratricopeptide repeat n=1 Tax=Solimicrobium silvestre TaxID=2099400 RepID=A0A2S9H1Q6_9BURK|nr:hypothetical protein [Solimicrobium silvestre]PRC93925.1 Tetratricopeptide repeat [Solimicrobium silvestre]
MNSTPNTANPSSALTRMLGYLEQDPQNEPLTFDTIDLCLAENNLDLTDRLLLNAAKNWPEALGVLNRKAIVALRRNTPHVAIIELEKIMASGKADAAIRYNLAYANYLIGNYARTCEVIKPALDDADRIPGLDSIYVLSLHQRGEIDTAIAYAEKRLKTKPTDTELQGVLALLYLDAEKDIDTCRQYTYAALRSNPNHPMALVTASALSMMDEKPAAAVEFAQKIISRNPSDGRAWSSIGVAQMYLLDLPAAQTALKNAVQHMSNHIGTWHGLAWTQLLQNDIDGAEASYNQAIELDRTFGESQAGLAIIAQLRGDKIKAKRLMDRAKRLAPSAMTLHYLKLLQLEESGDHSTAQSYLQDVLKRTPSFMGDSVLDMVRRMGRSNIKTD